MLNRSAVTATRRAPTRSISGPASALTTTSGSISATPTRPVRAADPVVVSTSHGMAIIDTRVPVSDTASAVEEADQRSAAAHGSSPPPSTTRPRERRQFDDEVRRIGVLVGLLVDVHQQLVEVLDERAGAGGGQPDAVVAERRGRPPLRREQRPFLHRGLQLLGHHHGDRLQVRVQRLAVLGQLRIAAVRAGRLVRCAPPAVAVVAALRILDDEAVLGELPQVVGRLTGVDPQPGGQRRRRRRTVRAEQAENSQPGRMAQRAQHLWRRGDGGEFHTARLRLQSNVCKDVFANCPRVSRTSVRTAVSGSPGRSGADTPRRAGRPRRRAPTTPRAPRRTARATVPWTTSGPSCTVTADGSALTFQYQTGCFGLPPCDATIR